MENLKKTELSVVSSLQELIKERELTARALKREVYERDVALEELDIAKRKLVWSYLYIGTFNGQLVLQCTHSDLLNSFETYQVDGEFKSLVVEQCKEILETDKRYLDELIKQFQPTNN